MVIVIRASKVQNNKLDYNWYIFYFTILQLHYCCYCRISLRYASLYLTMKYVFKKVNVKLTYLYAKVKFTGYAYV